MIELKLNNSKMGLRSSTSIWEWYTAKVGELGSIHIHNDTPSGKWTYKITTIREQVSKSEYEDKDTAFVAALSSFTQMVISAKSELAELGIV